jgi:hypothetical protein
MAWLDRWIRWWIAVAAMAGLTWGQAGPVGAGEVIRLPAKETLTAVEMDHGDELRVTLHDGRVVRLELEHSSATIIQRVEPGGVIYQFSLQMRVDGQPMTMRRFVGSQDSFYEPYVVSGLRIWPDSALAVFDLIPIRYPRLGNLQCLPRKAVRLALQDASRRICPDPLHPWLDEPDNTLDVGRCYNGDDSYLGAYLGQALHVGLDINHPAGSLLMAPLDLDTHGYFNSLEMGHNNNRWRGIRRWENGDVWALQSHHLIRLLVPSHRPLAAGTKYATTAGVHVGSHEHTHFEFKIGRKDPDSPLSSDADPASIAHPIDFDDQSKAAQAAPEVLHLDPWIVFWQIFEDRRRQQGEVRAAMSPLAPVVAGQPVRFSAGGSQPGRDRQDLTYHWTFGDGAVGYGHAPQHAFAGPGIYPVTLVVDDGQQQATHTQHVVVSGSPTDQPVLVLTSPESLSFVRRPVHAVDTYGAAVDRLPHTLEFVAAASRPRPASQSVWLQNPGGGRLDQATAQPEADPTDWLRLEIAGQGNSQTLDVAVDATGLAPGIYTARVRVESSDAVNSPQTFGVRLKVREAKPVEAVIVDDRDPGFFATPYFWVGHRFSRVPRNRRGHGGFYLTNGGQAVEGQFARFTPDLAAGQYEVAFSDATPFPTGSQFTVRIRHRQGETTRRVRPDASRGIGTFPFHEGTDGYVEIQAGDSQGLVIADAIQWRPTDRHGNADDGD